MESKRRFENDVAEAATLSGAVLDRLLAPEVEKWRQVARETIIKAR